MLFIYHMQHVFSQSLTKLQHQHDATLLCKLKWSSSAKWISVVCAVESVSGYETDNQTRWELAQV